MTVERVIPYWHTHIVPLLRKQEAVCICAHGNSLRGLVKYLEEMSDEDITTFEIPTGVPLVYTLTEELTVKDKLFLKETK
jgi:2,3-bisphosphoglycerate-dependent phosphoglycerate mutase